MTTLIKYDAACKALAVLPTRRDVRRFYGSAEWRDLKGAALYVKGRKCTRCGTTERSPHVDHITPVRVSWAARLSMWNLQVLCATCHSSHKRLEEHAKWR